MLRNALIALVGFLVIASALDATLESSLFYIDEGNSLSYELFQTRRGIIAYDYAGVSTQEAYVLINIETKNVSNILSDIVTACSNGVSSNFDRLHYHVATSTLLYYCINNNTLLIIDEDTYTVERTIPTNVNATFDEVRLVPQGYSIVILGMTGNLTQTSSTSQLITIDLQSHTVANNVVFNHDFDTGETVVGYAASSKNLLYVLTSKETGSSRDKVSYRVTLYSMFLIGNSYTINNLKSFAYDLYPAYSNLNSFPELYSVGTLLVVTYNETLAVLSSQGNVLGTIQSLATKASSNLNTLHVALAVQYGSPDFYALLTNSTLLKFSVDKGGYNVETYASNVVDMQYITSNQSSSSLLFTIDVNNLFNITDLQTSQAIYSTVSGVPVYLVTDTTYACLWQPSDKYLVFIFNRETNLLIYQGELGVAYFYDENSQLISYMDFTNSNLTQCHMVQFNIQTATSEIPFVLDTSYGHDCWDYEFLNVTNDLGTSQFLLEVSSNNLMIKTENFELAQFNDYNGDYDFPFVDYETLTVYIASTTASTLYNMLISVYTYDPSTQSFSLENSTKIGALPIENIYATSEQLVIFSIQDPTFEFLDIKTSNQIVFSYSGNSGSLQEVSFFQDTTGALYAILGFSGFPHNCTLYSENQDTVPLPGVASDTFYCYSAGQCRYSVMGGAYDALTASFYNVCSEEDLFDIIA